MSEEVTLDHFWLGSANLASFAAQAMTERQDGAVDSIWSMDPYGSDLVRLLQIGSSPLVRRELERILNLVPGSGAIISTANGSATVALVEVTVHINPFAVEAE